VPPWTADEIVGSAAGRGRPAERTAMGKGADGLLRKALTVNAVVSGACGLVLLVGGSALHRPFGLTGAEPLWTVGLLLMVFAGLLVQALRRTPLQRRDGLIFLASDVAYVAATLALYLLWPEALSALGRMALLLTTDVVAALAVAEYLGLRRMSPSRVAAAA
jgi:hypothetical protein